MLKLNGVSKSYITSSNRVDALTDINISFGTNGLVFILGASGSGKTTLLNLIGGLDTSSSGDILINNKKISNDRSSLELYRNNYISFVFQDFNLLPNLTVYENISMVCCEQDFEHAKEKVADILNKVNLGGYENRYPNQLSGGEIQRVVIARALFKNSSIILADEPTGNLNKENSKNVLEILKKISNEKLVIVVSHNEDLAYEYADRIIKLEDGKITHDIIRNEIKNKTDNFEVNNYVISKKNIFKLSFKNLFDKKIRFIISIISIILAFSILSLSLVISGFERPYVDAKNINDNSVEKYIISSNQDHIWIYNSDAEHITQYDGLTYIRNNVIKSIDDVIEMEYELYSGFREIDDESIILSDSNLFAFIESGKLYNISNDQEVLKDEFDFTNINQYYIKDPNKIYISAVYHSYGFNSNDYNVDNPDTIVYDKAKRNLSEQIIFHTEESVYNESYRYFLIGNSEGEFQVSVNKNNISSMVIGLDDIATFSIFNGSYFNDVEYITNAKNIIPGDDEIYLSLDVYNSFFGEKSDYTYYLGTNFPCEELVRAPIHINEKIDIKIIENRNNKEALEIKNLTVKGIIYGRANEIIVSAKNKKKIDNFTTNNIVLVKTSSVKNQYDFLKMVYREYGFFANYFYTERLTAFEDGLSIARFVSNILIPLMIILIVLINTIVISQIVKSKDKENGILRAMGIKKKSILNIYLLQSVFVILISFIISLIIAIIFIKVTNYSLVYKYSPTVSLLLFRYKFAMLILVITVIVNFAISYLSLYNAISKNPIDVIRLR